MHGRTTHSHHRTSSNIKSDFKFIEKSSLALAHVYIILPSISVEKKAFILCVSKEHSNYAHRHTQVTGCLCTKAKSKMITHDQIKSH